jgi:diguanylate cyclase (GGDEF)-like protein
MKPGSTDRRQPRPRPGTRAALAQQVAGLRAELARLQLELATARAATPDTLGAHLREANEQLVLSALRAQESADTAADQFDQLIRNSQLDGLTRTPNRALMLDRLEQAMALARRHGTRTAVLFIDLDAFKPVNDTLGHGVGDALLQLTARRLESVVRESDTVCRYGGDEFLVVLAEVLQVADARLIAEKMLAAVAAPCVIQTHALQMAASIGIALYPDDGDDVTSLIRHADAAMYRIKHRGGDGFERHLVVDPTESSADAEG